MNGIAVLRRREAHRLWFKIERIERCGGDASAERQRFDALMAGPPDAPGLHDEGVNVCDYTWVEKH